MFREIHLQIDNERYRTCRRCLAAEVCKVGYRAP